MHRAGPQDAMEHDVELRAVRQEHRDPVARRDAAPDQQGREPVGVRIEFCPADLGAVVDDRGVVGTHLRPVRQMRRQGDPAQRIARLTGDSRGPGLVHQACMRGEIGFFLVHCPASLAGIFPCSGTV
jgi:hypothetical protein